MILEINDLIYLITKYNNISDNYFKILTNQIKNLLKYICNNDDFFNDDKIDIDIFNDVEDVYGILILHYKPTSIRNMIGLIIRILEINELKYLEKINEYKEIFNTLNKYYKSTIGNERSNN